MRNLKRALSLAVASVMLVGMMVVGTSASYEDVSSDYNQEAIEVLQAVGIMVGDEDGNFNPDAAVSRNEMAVIMSNLMDYRVATYAGTSPFTDVPTWAEPYVAACYTNGIVGGIGNNLYGGSYTVTTSEAALMLMKALGYFQYASDFGDEWQLAVTKQANKIELLDGIDAGVKEALTRNDVAQLVLNTLKSGMVEPDDDTIKVTTDSATVEAGNVNYVYVSSGKDYAKAIDDAEAAWSSTTISTQGYIVQLGEKLYQGDLRLDDDTQDAFGRPAVTWTYKVDEVGTYADDPIAVYTAKVSQGELYTLIGSSNVGKLRTYNTGKNSLNVYADGDPVTVASITTLFDRNSSIAAGKGNTNTAAIAGKGVLTEVYQDNDNNVTIVFVNTYVAQATTDYNENKGDVTITVLTGPATTVTSLEDDDFDVADYKADDYILYTYADSEIQDIAPAKLVTGEVNAYSQKNYVKIDGTKYDYAEKIDGNEYENGTAQDSAVIDYVVTDIASIVLDAYGYVIYVDDASISVGNYVFIDKIAAKSGLSSSAIANATFSDGVNEEITLKSLTKKGGATVALGSLGASWVDNSGAFQIGWYSYTKTSEGKYKLTEAATNDSFTTNKIENGKAYINGTKTIAGTDDTIVLVDDGDDVNVYTGIKNIPDIEDTTSSNRISVYYMLKSDETGKTAILVYVDASATGVTVKDSTKDSLLYVLKLDSTHIDTADAEPIRDYIVVLDGVITTIQTKDSTLTVGQLYNRYSVDSDGYYEADSTDVFSGTDTDKAVETLSGATLSYDGSTLTIHDSGISFANANGDAYFLLADTDITLVTLPTSNTSTLATQIMKDRGASWEATQSMSGKTLANLFKNYSVDGTLYVGYTDDNIDIAEVLYLVVTEATRLP